MEKTKPDLTMRRGEGQPPDKCGSPHAPAVIERIKIEMEERT
jgi:hypothetical protein